MVDTRLKSQYSTTGRDVTDVIGAKSAGTFTTHVMNTEFKKPDA